MLRTETIERPDRPRQNAFPSLARADLAIVPAFIVLALTILWAAHDGGYDQDTWYWGALVVLGLLAVTLSVRAPRVTTPAKIALVAFAIYVGWSYLSMAWASSPGDALNGSNRALLYLLIFALFSVAPWTDRRALVALIAFTLGIGALEALIFLRMAGGNDPGALFSGGRLVSPTGYFNASSALFMYAALLGVGLATKRELPAVLRGLLLAISCGGAQLALLGESRGWLFTLPFVLLAAIIVVPNRLRTAALALLPIGATLAVLSPLLGVYRATEGTHPSKAGLLAAVHHAGRWSLVVCGVMLLIGIGLAVIDDLVGPRTLGVRTRRAAGTGAIVLALAAGAAAGVVATHGHPFRFVSKQWHGFTHVSPSQTNLGSHFATVGSGRYDMWRVALDATLAHPVGGLGQDNFADYYIRHRRTAEEPQWTHSLPLRLLAQTGFVGALIFGVFLVAALIAAARARRRAPPQARAVAGWALLPLVVWLIHGSVDWFWEMPSLSGPALAFLGMAGALAAPARLEAPMPAASGAGPSGRARPILIRAGAVIAFVAAVIVLAFPYLSVREVSTATDIRARNPAAALHDLDLAAKLDPFNAAPGRLAGAIALQTDRFSQAERSFSQSIAREPGGWFAWLGAGLAASALGDTAKARQDFQVAVRINNRQPADTEALRRVDTTHPLTIREAFKLLVVVQ